MTSVTGVTCARVNVSQNPLNSRWSAGAKTVVTIFFEGQNDSVNKIIFDLLLENCISVNVFFKLFRCNMQTANWLQPSAAHFWSFGPSTFIDHFLTSVPMIHIDRLFQTKQHKWQNSNPRRTLKAWADTISRTIMQSGSASVLQSTSSESLFYCFHTLTSLFT